MPASYQAYVENCVKNNPKNVRVIRKSRGTFWEVRMNVYGFDVFYRVEDFFSGKKKNTAQVWAFNHGLGICYVRDLLDI